MTIREDIFGTDDLAKEMVPTPEWPTVDGKVFARCLSGDERDQWEVFMAHQVDMKPIGDDETRLVKLNAKHLRATLVALGTCDEDGDSLFGKGDVVLLGLKSAAPLERIRGAIRRLSGMDDDDEETAKNLPEVPGSNSSTDSPLPSGTPAPENSSES